MNIVKVLFDGIVNLNSANLLRKIKNNAATVFYFLLQTNLHRAYKTMMMNSALYIDYNLYS